MQSAASVRSTSLSGLRPQNSPLVWSDWRVFYWLIASSEIVQFAESKCLPGGKIKLLVVNNAKVHLSAASETTPLKNGGNFIRLERHIGRSLSYMGSATL